MRLRLYLMRLMCKLLMPGNIFVGKHFGAYTCRRDVVFGVLDCRGVLQGSTIDSLCRAYRENK